MKTMKTLLALLIQLAALGAALSADRLDDKAESTLQMLLRVTGISAVPALRGEEISGTGSVWVAALAESQPVRWTATGGFRSPVFNAAGTAIYAMQSDVLVRIDGAGVAPVIVSKAADVEKLIGFDSRAPDGLVMLMSDRAAPLAVLSLTTGKLALLPFDPANTDQQRLLANLRGQSRASASLRVLVEKKDRQDLARVVEWTDVEVQVASGTMRNLSKCNGVNCFQPALSPDLTRVVFVKGER
jgi:hypothetical protein